MLAATARGLQVVRPCVPAKGGERIVGDAAKRQAVTNSRNTIYSIKRFMGRKFHEVSGESARVPYRVIKADNGDAWVDVRDKKHSPPEVSAMILQKLKKAANKTAEGFKKAGDKIDKKLNN